MWRLYSGMNFLATLLSRMALKLEHPISDDERALEVAPLVHAIVEKASQLLPLLHPYVDALAAAGPADVQAAGASTGARQALCNSGISDVVPGVEMVPKHAQRRRER